MDGGSWAQSSRAEVGLSDGSRVDVNCQGTSGEQSSVSSAGASKKKGKTEIRKASAETRDHVCCLDLDVGSDKSLEKMGFLPGAVSDSAVWREPLNVKYMCDNMCNEEGFKFFFFDIAAIVVEDDGKPHTINFCRTCFDCRMAEKGEPKVDLSGQMVGRFRVGWIPPKVCGSDVRSRGSEQITCWKKQRKRCSWRQAAAGNMSHRGWRSSSSCENVMTCGWKAP